MPPLFALLTQRLGRFGSRLPPDTGGRVYRCVCRRPVFFRNSACLACKTQLGYDCELSRVVPIEPAGAPDMWKEAVELADPSLAAGPAAAVKSQGDDAPGGSLGPTALDAVPVPPERRYMRCGNFGAVVGCNWLVPVNEATGTAPKLCVSCGLNRTIPNLDDPDNEVLWRKVEIAKRRLVSQLLSLGLPVEPRGGPSPRHGLRFNLLRTPPGGPRITTGHADGLITLDIDEADDVRREQVRALLHEPYRTLLGHFRHEVGHYYWDRLVLDTPWIGPFRELFGDERVDYAESLRANYECGPPPDWQLHYVSGYASSHPWEDWAETWAQYLHMIDIVDTALSFGLDTAHVEIESEPFDVSTLWRRDLPDAHDFLHFLNTWVQLTHMLNEMSRSMGQPDFYPFVLPRAAVAKLQLIHMVVSDAPFPGAVADAAAQVPASPQPQPQPPTREPLPETIGQPQAAGSAA